MAEEKKNKNSWTRKLNKRFRLVVLNEEDLSEAAVYSHRLKTYLTYFLLTLVATAMLTTTFIFLSPVRTLVPGYKDIEQNVEFLTLRDRLLEIEEELKTQQVYTNGLKNMLVGNSPSELNNLSEIDQKMNDAIINRSENEQVIARSLDNLYFTAPVNGSVSAGFDREINHLGVDVLAPKSTPIKSILHGTVLSSDWTLETGNTIMIQHEGEVISVYKHNSTLLKKTGEKVKAGEAIAIIGNTGTLSDGPHLHFELWYDGLPIDPENFINFK